MSYLYQAASNLERQNINPWYFILHYFLNVAHALWITATVSCEREHREAPSRHRSGSHLADTRLHKHHTNGTRSCQRTRGAGGGGSAPPSLRRNPRPGGGGHRRGIPEWGPGATCELPSGLLRFQHGPVHGPKPAKPRRPAHRTVTRGSARPPVAGPGSPIPCQITRGTAAAAQLKHSPSTATLSAAILAGHMTRARHGSGGGGVALRGRDPWRRAGSAEGAWSRDGAWPSDRGVA